MEENTSISTIPSYAEASFVTTLVVILMLWLVPLVAFPTDQTTDTDSSSQKHEEIPFIVIGDPSWSELRRAMDHYHQEVSQIMNGLSKSLEVTIMSEMELFGSNNGLFQKRLQRRIDELSRLLELDAKVLEHDLLQPFPLIQVIADKAHFEKDEDCSENGHCEESFFLPRFTTYNKDTSCSYDSAAQVTAHMVRDWTSLGRELRRSTYHWCLTQLQVYHTKPSGPVLVPGAGLGRLAYDLSQDGYNVEANDSSLIMASAAHSMLSRQTQGILHPFAMDFFNNEVDSEQRYEAVSFQNVDDNRERRGSLSYTVGDFVELYSAPYSRGVYGAVVTCFFLDTATNIYEYLVTASSLLAEGGVWINVGPVQWHQNALVRPSVAELRLLIENMGFDILLWSVDEKPVNYRHDEEPARVRSTKYEAYRPLRFVAVRQALAPVTTRLSATYNLRVRSKSTSTVTGYASDRQAPFSTQSTLFIEELTEEEVT